MNFEYIMIIINWRMVIVSKNWFDYSISITSFAYCLIKLLVRTTTLFWGFRNLTTQSKIQSITPSSTFISVNNYWNLIESCN